MDVPVGAGEPSVVCAAEPSRQLQADTGRKDFTLLHSRLRDNTGIVLPYNRNLNVFGF